MVNCRSSIGATTRKFHLDSFVVGLEETHLSGGAGSVGNPHQGVQPAHQPANKAVYAESQRQGGSRLLT